MAKRNVHVVPANGEWAVRRGGSERASRVENTQRQAIEQANRIGQRERVEVIIHGRDGRIREKNSHGNDPFPPRDKR